MDPRQRSVRRMGTGGQGGLRSEGKGGGYAVEISLRNALRERESI